MQKKTRTLTKESLGWGVKNGSTWGGRVRDKWKGLSLGWLAPTDPAQPWTSFLRRDQIWTNLVSEARSAGLKVAQQGDLTPVWTFSVTFSSFWPLVQTFSPRYKLLQITDLCSSHQKCSLELNRFLVLKPFMIFCLFYVKQMDWGNHRGDFNSLPEASFWNLPLWKVFHGWFASKPTQWTIFFQFIVLYYFGWYCNAAAPFPSSDPGAVWVSNSPIFIRPNFPFPTWPAITSRSFTLQTVHGKFCGNWESFDTLHIFNWNMHLHLHLGVISFQIQIVRNSINDFTEITLSPNNFPQNLRWTELKPSHFPFRTVPPDWLGK